MKPRLRLVGLTLAVAAGAFFLHRAWQAFHTVDFRPWWSWPVGIAFAGLCLLSLVQVPLTAIAWRRILRDLGLMLSAGGAYAILATTQFAKYLPGNVAQHLGRVAVARRFVCDVPRVALSLLYENAVALLVGTHLAAALLLLGPGHLATRPWLPRVSPLLLLSGVTIVALAALLLLPWLLGRIRRVTTGGAPLGARLSVSGAACCYAVFLFNFAAVGLGFSWMLQAMVPGAEVTAWHLTSAFATAWVIGLLAPGAPAGLGVREAVLLALLPGTVPQAAAVTSILLLRIATTLADLLHFWAGTTQLPREIARLP